MRRDHRATIRWLSPWCAAALLLAGCQGPETAAEREEQEAEERQAQRTAVEAPEQEQGLIERIFEPEPVTVHVPAGTVIAVRMQEGLSSETSATGERFRAVVVRDVTSDGAVVVPARATLQGTVTEAKGFKKIGGRARLALDFHTMRLPSGGDVPIDAGFSRVSKSETPKDAGTIAGATIAGAILGHQVDDDEGKIVGGLVGGGVGTAIAAKTKGRPVVVPAGTVLNLTLQSPVTVQVERRG